MTDQDQAAANRLMLLMGQAGLAAGVAGCAAASLAVAPQLCLLAAAGLAYRAFRTAPLAPGDSCGSARFCDSADLLAAGAFDGGPGLLVGEVPPPPLRDALRLLRRAPWRRSAGAVRVALAAITRRPLWARLPGVVHSAVFSPSGAGKTTAMVVPQLLTCDDSAVVIDPSGEIHAATAAARAARGHRVVVLDPAHLTGPRSDSLNPMAGLHPDQPDFLDRCRGLADALCVRTGREADPHWVESAILWIGAIVAWVAFVTAKRRSPELCNLQTVADILADQQELDTSIRMMKEERALGGMLARLAHKLGHAIDRERGSILSTVGRTLSALDTPQVAAATGHSTFDPADLPAKKVTVYVVISPEQLREKSGLARAWLTALLWASVRAGTAAAPVHYVLDEYAALAGGGRFQVVEDAVVQYRKYSVRCHFYLQGTGQLVQCFGEGFDKTFLANTTQVFLGASDLDTAQYVSDRCGQATVATLQQSTGGNTSSSTDSHGMQSSSSGSNDGASAQEAARALLTPDEVTRLGRVAVTFAAGLPAIMSRPARFFEPCFRAARESLAAPASAAAPLCALLMALGLAAGALACLGAARLLAPAPHAPNVRPHLGRPVGGPQWQKNESRGPRRAPPASWPPPP